MLVGATPAQQVSRVIIHAQLMFLGSAGFKTDYICVVDDGEDYACAMSFRGDYTCAIDVGGGYACAISF